MATTSGPLRVCSDDGVRTSDRTPEPSARNLVAAPAEVVAWHTAPDADGAAASITQAVVDVVASAESAGISWLHGRRHRPTGHGPTDETAAAMGRLHTGTADGPWRQALADRRPVEISAMVAETRWPAFTARAAELGVAAMLCLPLVVERGLGTLDLHSGTPGAFRDVDVEAAMVFATHAALALRSHAERANLERALATRDRIGQAKGIVMVRHELTAEQAYDRLVAASQHANIKLTDVADWLVDEQQRSVPGAAADA